MKKQGAKTKYMRNKLKEEISHLKSKQMAFAIKISQLEKAVQEQSQAIRFLSRHNIGAISLHKKNSSGGGWYVEYMYDGKLKSTNLPICSSQDEYEVVENTPTNTVLLNKNLKIYFLLQKSNSTIMDFTDYYKKGGQNAYIE